MKKTEYIKQLLTFNKRDRNGILFLACILFLMVLFSTIFSKITFRNIQPNNLNEFNKQIAIFGKQFDSLAKFKNINEKVEKNLVHTLFYFDPNNASEQDFIELGLSKFQIENIIKYREKGGKFSKAEDMSRIYGLDNQKFLELKPFIKIKKNSTKKAIIKNDIVSNSLKLELNSCTASDLKNRLNIEEVLSKRIIKYRNLLGGYYSFEQLSEVYGMDSILLNQVEKKISIDLEKIKKLCINSLSVNALFGHPYINKYQAESIYKYVHNVEKIENQQDLINNKIFDAEELEKLTYYIDYQ